MSERIKLTTEEHNELLQLQNEFNELNRRYGELCYQKKNVLAELDLADQAHDDLDTRRFESVKRLEEKYGIGNVNLVTGEFIPDNSNNG